MITWTMLHVAHALASAHGHEWGTPEIEDFLDDTQSSQRELTGEAEYVDENVLGKIYKRASATCGPVAGICAPTLNVDEFVHTTNSGRVSWRIYRDGVTVQLHRPTGAVFADAIRDTPYYDENYEPLLAELGKSRSADMVVGEVQFRGKEAVVVSPPIFYGHDGLAVMPKIREEHVLALLNVMDAAHYRCIADVVEELSTARAEGPCATTLLNRLYVAAAARKRDVIDAQTYSKMLNKLTSSDASHVSTYSVLNGVAVFHRVNAAGDIIGSVTRYTAEAFAALSLVNVKTVDDAWTVLNNKS